MKNSEIFPAFVFILFSVLSAWFGYAYPNIIVEAGKYFGFVVGIAWASINFQLSNLEAITDVKGLTIQQHDNLERIVQNKVRKTKTLSFLILICTILIITPIVFNQLQFLYLNVVSALSAFAVFFSLFSIILQQIWRNEFRLLKSEAARQERVMERRKKALEKLKFEDSDKEKDPALDGFRKSPTILS